MKNLKKVLALVLAVVMIMGVVSVASAKTYTDVKATDTYADAIDALSSLKILDGFEDGNFKADGTLTRAQAAKIVAIVHNAATNGAIKDQDAISGLYSNALNPFVDCNGNWALPFINYCRITGLADGMTATTYAPNRELTGVQWLKLMLTTLNFDTAKEGYTGTGWDINVLNRANEIGLTAGLADGWKAIAPVKRGEAAQILYNALTKSLVEYGQNIKGYTPPVPAVNFIKGAFVTNETVEATGVLLGAKMGITIERATDDFRRPGYNWSYGSWSAFYMDKPVNSYTTAVSACDILKNDMKVPETSSKVIHLNGHRKGITEGTTVDTTKASKLKVDGAAAAYTALNYYAVDGFKYVNNLQNGGVDEVTLNHTQTKSCQNIEKIGNHWSLHKFGGNGDLTQVFKTEDGWVITTIHTFLGEVKTLDKSNKYSHAKTETGTAQLWVRTTADVPTYGNEETTAFKTISTVDYAVGTRVLATVSFKNTEAANLTGTYYGATKTDAYIVDVAAAEAKTGKLTGASDATYPETVSIDGTKYNTNCRFVLGKEAAMNIKNDGKTFTFYFDTYGNVIGRVDNTTAASYVVMDRIYGVHENGKFALKADLYDLDGKAIEGADVAIAGSFAEAKDAYDNSGTYSGTPNWNYPNDNLIYMVSAHNDGNLVNSLYSYTLSDKGVYTLTWVGDATSAGIYPDTLKVTYGVAYGRLDASFAHTAKMAYIRATNVANDVHKIPDGVNADKVLTARENGYDLSVSESTKFVVKSAGGEWTAYTGYTALPALTASYVDYLDLNGDGYADIVYIGNAVFAADNVTGWVLKWTPFNWANGYDLITVYVDGEPVVVNVKHGAITGNDYGNPAQALRPGLYTFTTKVDENGVTYSEFFVADENANNFTGEAVESYSSDATAIKVKVSGNYTETIGLTDVVIYNVLADGTVVKADASCISAGDRVVYSKVANRYNAPYAVLYVLDKTIPY